MSRINDFKTKYGNFWTLIDHRELANQGPVVQNRD